MQEWSAVAAGVCIAHISLHSKWEQRRTENMNIKRVRFSELKWKSILEFAIHRRLTRDKTAIHSGFRMTDDWTGWVDRQNSFEINHSMQMRMVASREWSDNENRGNFRSIFRVHWFGLLLWCGGVWHSWLFCFVLAKTCGSTYYGSAKPTITATEEYVEPHLLLHCVFVMVAKR